MWGQFAISIEIRYPYQLSRSIDIAIVIFQCRCSIYRDLLINIESRFIDSRRNSIHIFIETDTVSRYIDILIILRHISICFSSVIRETRGNTIYHISNCFSQPIVIGTYKNFNKHFLFKNTVLNHRIFKDYKI